MLRQFRNGCEQLEERTLLAAGDLDPSFHGNGLLTTNLGAVLINKVAVQADEKIVVAGAIGAAGSEDFFLARFNADGMLDGSFGAAGVVRTDFGGDDRALDVAIDSHGRIVAAGGGGPNKDFAVARYTPAGALDGTFATGGKRLIPFGGEEVASSLALTPDDQVLLAGD